MSVFLKLFACALAIVFLCFGAFYLFARPPVSAPADAQQAAAASAEEEVIASSTIPGVHVGAAVISQGAPPPAGFVEYKNSKYGFSFYHSPEGKITEYDEGQGAETIVLQNDAIIRGMQVFIVPYSEPTISEARFHMDEPSGVRENAENATLNGVRAVTFNGLDQMLGDTREIWAIRNGYLYEITTFSGVGNWFTPIIQSWRWL